MRKIKFRGKSIMPVEELTYHSIPHVDEWVHGNFIGNGDRPMIVSDIYEEIEESIYPKWWAVVLPKTVGQYTGLKDKNGVEIYEGDVFVLNAYYIDFESYERRTINEYIPVTFEKGSFVLYERGIETHLLCNVLDGYANKNGTWHKEVIGNIHEHPHLLGEDD